MLLCLLLLARYCVCPRELFPAKRRSSIGGVVIPALGPGVISNLRRALAEGAAAAESGAVGVLERGKRIFGYFLQAPLINLILKFISQRQFLFVFFFYKLLRNKCTLSA